MSKKSKTGNKYFIGLATGILITLLIVKFIPILSTSVKGLDLPFTPKPTPTIDPAKQQEAILKEILPNQVDLGVSFGDTIVKMIKEGAIDKEKFEKLYEGRGGLSPDEKKLLEEASNNNIVVTQANSGLILNLLWPLGIANKTNVLGDGPMGTQYKKDVANFASTGGWTVGKISGGDMFNRFPILQLTKEQETLVSDIAQNIFRPCCGNSTYFPDCNHGAAMLGFIELAVASGMTKEEIYKKALALNSYWFPQTYAELDVYFKAKKKTSWNKVDAKEVLSANYSSSQGYRAVSKELQAEGLLPKVSGGGGCGV